MSLYFLLNGLLRFGYHQTLNIVKVVAGLPVITPSLISATLDVDDVSLARNELDKSAGWCDPAPVTEYESAFARWNGSKYSFAFMGGRIALSACIFALGLREGDDVIVPGYTCVVVPNAFPFAGINTT